MDFRQPAVTIPFSRICAVPLAVLCLVPWAVPAAAGEVFTLERAAELRLVDEARISPSGEHVAYVLRVPRDPYAEGDGAAWDELHAPAGVGAQPTCWDGKIAVDPSGVVTPCIFSRAAVVGEVQPAHERRVDVLPAQVQVAVVALVPAPR